MGNTKKNVVAIAFFGVLVSSANTAASVHDDEETDPSSGSGSQQNQNDGGITVVFKEVDLDEDLPPLDDQDYLSVLHKIGDFDEAETDDEADEVTIDASYVEDVTSQSTIEQAEVSTAFDEHNVDSTSFSDVDSSSDSPVISVFDKDFHSGGSLKFAVENFPPNQDIVLSIGEHVFIDDIKTTDDQGSLDTQLHLPDNISSGDSTLRLSGDGFTFAKEIKVSDVRSTA